MAAPGVALYGQKIAAPTDLNHGFVQKEVAAEAVKDLTSTLQKMTGAEFAITQEYSGPGIFLVRTDSPHAPADAVAQLKGKGREPFIIRSDGADKLWIISNGDDGLSHGIYFYLEQLGVRFYFPNDNWTIIPERRDVTLKVDRLVAPTFKRRSFFGTGGFYHPSPLTPEISMQERWQDWQRRNRFGAEFNTGGHAGHAFNLEYAELLQKNPQYLAKGDTLPWKATRKLNTANKEVVQLFVDWSVEQMRKARAKDPNAFSVGVGPPDGSGYCDTEECKQIGSGSVSDQVFYVANLAARAVAKEFPDGYVSLYAYAAHADLPTFDLEPNVFVVVTPYAFNSTGMGAVELIEAWGRKAGKIGLRDYWSITDWADDMPKFDYINTPAQKLRLWRDNNVITTSVESTYSAGAMGIGWYVASRLMWDPDQPVEPLLNEFYDDAFGPARPPMQRMLEGWATDFRLDSQQLAIWFRDMQEAMELAAGNEAVLARLDDYGKYLQFLRLYHEYSRGGEDLDKVMEKRVALLRHIWSIYPSAMVHTTRHHKRLLQFGRLKELTADFDTNDKTAAGWQEGVGPRTHQDVMEWLTDGAKDYPLLDFTERSYEGALVRLDKSPLTRQPEWSPVMLFAGSTEFELEATPEVLRFPLRVSNVTGTTTAVQVLDRDGKTVFATEVAGTDDMKKVLTEIPVTLPQPGRYRLLLENKGQSINVQAPSNVPLTWRKFYTFQGAPSPPIYFYVPTGLKKVAISDQNGLMPRFYNAAGDQVTPETYDGNHLLLLPVAPGQDGKVWSVEFLRLPKRELLMLNAPQAFSFFPETLMVPEDALQ